jgi:hypothetical protein
VTRRPTCHCDADYYDGHCLSCGAADASVPYRPRAWVIVAAVIALLALGAWLAGFFL